MNALYPLRLRGVTKSPIWGGTRLLTKWNKKSDGKAVGESWELCVRKEDMCRVDNGAFCGTALGELIDRYGRALTGSDVTSQNFPLLIKLLDAADTLSVQVHPDDAYASRVENDRGKTEMWYIIEADEGAELICGLKEGMTAVDLAQAVADGCVESVLRHQPVRPGEVYFIPAGYAHAIGKGILLAEIQQNCDLTYRVYDFNRRQPDGSLRELHVEKALEVIRPFSKEEIDAIRYSRADGNAPSPNVLADCDYFRVEKLTAQKEEGLIPHQGRMRHLLCIRGSGAIYCNGEEYEIKKGDSWLLPACLGEVLLTGDAELLLTLANPI
ncbi:MAG: class I mannose-6-phosphate isomerase [Clostridia bacterium]|nr:class I mannose-6-phosphate isomerase [Clostridia bacterium]